MHGLKTKLNLGIKEIEKGIIGNYPELKDENLQFLIQSLLTHENVIAQTAEELDHSEIFPSQSNSNNEVVERFGMAYEKAKEIFIQPNIIKKIETFNDAILLPSEELKIKLYATSLIYLYGEHGIAIIKNTFDDLNKTNSNGNYETILFAMKRYTYEHFSQETFKELQEVWKDIYDKTKHVLDPLTTISLLLTLNNAKNKNVYAKNIEPQQTKDIEEKIVDNVEKTAQQIIDNNMLDDEIIRNIYLRSSANAIRIYSETGLIISPIYLEQFERELKKYGISPHGTFGKYNMDEAILNANDILREKLGRDLYSNIGSKNESLSQELILKLAVYDYVNGKDSVKELLDEPKISKLLEGLFENDEHNKQNLREILKNIDGMATKQTQVLGKSVYMLFNSNSNKENILQLKKQLEANKDVNLFLEKQRLDMLGGIAPLIYTDNGERIYAYYVQDNLTEMDKQIYQVAQNEKTWQQIQRQWEIENESEIFVERTQNGVFQPIHFENVEREKGGSPQFLTIGGQVLLDQISACSKTIKDNWSKSVGNINNWDGTVLQIAEDINDHPSRYKLSDNAKQGMPNYIKFLRAVEKGIIENYSQPGYKISQDNPIAKKIEDYPEWEYTPEQDIYFSIANYATKWQDYFENGVYELSQKLGWVKLYNGNTVITNPRTQSYDRIEVTEEGSGKIKELLNDKDQMLRYSYAYTILGPDVTSLLYKYEHEQNVDWFTIIQTKPSQIAGKLKDDGIKIGRLTRRLGTDYKDGYQRIQSFMDKTKTLWNNTPNLLETLQSNNYNNETFKELALIFEKTLMENADAYKQDKLFPLYFRFYKYDEKGQITGPNIVNIRNELKKMLNDNVTDGFNPIITLSFLVSGNTYETDYEGQFHSTVTRQNIVNKNKDITNTKQIRTENYVPSFAPIAMEKMENIRMQQELIKRLGIDGSMKLPENVSLDTTEANLMKWRNLDNEIMATMYDGDDKVTIQEITVNPEDKEVISTINTQTLLRVQQEKINGPETQTQTSTTSKVKDANITIEIRELQDDGTLETITKEISGPKIKTNKNGQYSYDINLNEQNKKGEYTFEKDKTYVILAKAQRDDLGQTIWEHINTFKMQRNESFKSAVPREMPMPIAPTLTYVNYSAYTFNRANIAIRNMDGKTLIEILEGYYNLHGIEDPSTNETTYSFNDRSIIVNSDQEVIAMIDREGNRIESSTSGFDEDYFGPLVQEKWSELLIKTDTDELAKTYFRRLYVNTDETLTSYGQEMYDDLTPALNHLGSTLSTSEFINELDIFIKDKSEWDLTGYDTSTMTLDEARELLNNNSIPNFAKYNLFAFNLGLSHAYETSLQQFRPYKINKMYLQGSLNINDLFNWESKFNVKGSFGIYINEKSGEAYISDPTELPPGLKDKATWWEFTPSANIKGEWNITDHLGSSTKLFYNASSTDVKTIFNSIDTEGLHQETLNTIASRETPRLLGVQQMLGYLVSEKVKAKAGAGYTNVSYESVKGYDLLTFGAGAELYLNNYDIDLMATHNLPLGESLVREGVKLRDTQYSSLMFTIGKPLDAQKVHKIGLAFTYNLFETYRQQNYNLTYNLNEDIEANVGVNYIENKDVGYDASVKIDGSKALRLIGKNMKKAWDWVF